MITPTNGPTTTTPAVVTIPPVVLSTSQLLFKDTGSNWASDYINNLAVRKIINNTDFFRPNDTLTRAEFLKIVGNTAGWKLETINANPFTDVSKTEWYAPYASYALGHGIISQATRFRPNDPISRAEVAKILAGALGLTLHTPTGVFADVSISSSLVMYVEAVKAAGIFDGQITTTGRLIFRPSDSITRAEIAKVVVKAFKL